MNIELFRPVYILLKRFARVFGFEFRVYRKRQAGIVNEDGYETIRTLATYAPWSLDKKFSEVYDKISGHTMVDVYQSAKDVFDWVWPRVTPGGIVVFDDYGFKGCDGVTRFVDEEHNKQDRFFTYNLNGHAIFLKTSLG